MQHFFVYVDGKQLRPFPTLEEAKDRAQAYIDDGNAVHIERYAGMVASDFWRFDREVSDWVYSKSL